MTQDRYILAVLQDAGDGKDIEKRKFTTVKNAVAWMRANCKLGKLNGALFEINALYDYSCGYVEYSSAGQVVTRSFDDDTILLWKERDIL